MNMHQINDRRRWIELGNTMPAIGRLEEWAIVLRKFTKAVQPSVQQTCQQTITRRAELYPIPISVEKIKKHANSK